MTPKELRSIELLKKFQRHDLAENLTDFHLLTDTLIYLHESLSDENVEIQYWKKDSETLLHKFAFHALTLHSILSGLKLSSVYLKGEMANTSVIDISSGKAVLRALLEAFLMYHYIYVNPSNDDLKELRYNAWIYSSIMQRQGFPAETKFGKDQKAKDLEELTKMKDSISKLKAFQDLSDKQKLSLLNSGSGKLFNHWVAILKETGFSEKNPFFTLYSFLSIYSHSEGLSIVQLAYQPNNRKNIETQADLDLHHGKLLVCLMITSVVQLYEVVKNRYDTLPEQLRYDIELCSMMAMKNRI